MLGGAVSDWLTRRVGVRDPAGLLPSVRFAVESAVLSALAASAAGTDRRTDRPDDESVPSPASAPLSRMLLLGAARDALFPATTVEINALIGDDVATPEAAAAEAKALVDAGHRCLKVKVARGSGPAGARDDAIRLAAIRAAVGPDVAIRADANRRWSLNDALTFGLQASNINLEYVEEPVADPMADLSAFHCTTGVPVALDESVDEALAATAATAAATAAAAATALADLMEPTFGVVALVLKPSVLGGFEACAAAAAAARSRGISSVVTTAFDAGVGTAACAHLAAALDAAAVAAASDCLLTATAADEAAEAAAITTTTGVNGLSAMGGGLSLIHI